MLARRMTPQFFLEGDVICFKGDYADNAYILTKGRVVIGEEEDPIVIPPQGVKTPQIFGEMALFSPTTSCGTRCAHKLRSCWRTLALPSWPS